MAQSARDFKPTLHMLGYLFGKYVRPQLKLFLGSIAFMVLAAVSTAAFAKLIQPVLDTALISVQTDASSFGAVYWLAAGIFICFSINGLATYAHVILMNLVSQRFVAKLQHDVFAHFLSLDLRFFQQQGSGELVSRVTNDVNMMRMAVVESLTGAGKSILTLILLIGVMFYQDWRLALITLTVFPLAIYGVAKIGRRIRKISTNIQAETASLLSVLTQIFQGIRHVQAYGMEEYERNRAGAAVNKVRDLNTKSVRVANMVTPINELLVATVVVSIIIYGSINIAKGELTPGQLMSFIGAFSLAYEPLRRLGKINASFQSGLGAMDRVMAMFEIKPKLTSPEGAPPVKIEQAIIEFENVSFVYDDGEEQISALENVSFKLEPGKVTALVGASGSGKTTLMNLLPRFFDPTQGRVLINGQDLRDVNLASLRASIAFVSQDVAIFDDTVANNIGYGRLGATQEEIQQAAILAAADEFVQAMPEGYQTRVGEHGMRLSGGQKQRIAIARAILRDAPILLLDEATSALDNTSERLIQKSLHELERGRTVLVIAHRLSTVEHADEIIVLDNGRIVERGTHKGLLAQDGVYATMATGKLFKEKMKGA